VLARTKTRAAISALAINCKMNWRRIYGSLVYNAAFAPLVVAPEWLAFTMTGLGAIYARFPSFACDAFRLIGAMPHGRLRGGNERELIEALVRSSATNESLYNAIIAHLYIHSLRDLAFMRSPMIRSFEEQIEAFAATRRRQPRAAAMDDARSAATDDARATCVA
jgi:hypothetical protein